MGFFYSPALPVYVWYTLMEEQKDSFIKPEDTVLIELMYHTCCFFVFVIMLLKDFVEMDISISTIKSCKL